MFKDAFIVLDFQHVLFIGCNDWELLQPCGTITLAFLLD